jgi:hypothetical protein
MHAIAGRLVEIWEWTMDGATSVVRLVDKELERDFVAGVDVAETIFLFA